MANDPIRIGTRGSALALMQAGLVRRAIEAQNPGLAVEIVKISTKGDQIPDVPLHKIGLKGVFIKEIEEELLNGGIDIAVHSLKDLPCRAVHGLTISAYLPRENPGDVLISEKYASLNEMPEGASVGAGSRRRESQLREARPGIMVSPLRGNVETRMNKTANGGLDAVVIAAAGVLRLGLAGKIREYLPPSVFTPAPGQGIIAVQTRAGDERTASIVRKADDAVSRQCYEVEREFLLETGGGCFLPVGALCEKKPEGFILYGYIGSKSGKAFRDKISFSDFEPRKGKELAGRLLAAGGREALLEFDSHNQL